MSEKNSNIDQALTAYDSFMNREKYPLTPDECFKAPSLTFGEALEAVKQGRLVQRAGWNGKGMFIFQRPEDYLPISFIPSVKSLPEAVKKKLGEIVISRCAANGRPDTTITEPAIKFTAYLCMYAADGSIVNGWLASQTDMLAEDWQIIG